MTNHLDKDRLHERRGPNQVSLREARVLGGVGAANLSASDTIDVAVPKLNGSERIRILVRLIHSSTFRTVMRTVAKWCLDVQSQPQALITRALLRTL
jgi:hypothetical protein